MSQVEFEGAMERCRKVVYKNRIRIKEFLTDFDRLRCGLIFENHFVTALSMAGLDKQLSPCQIAAITEYYKVPVSPSLTQIRYRDFVEDVDLVFTAKGLEKTPERIVEAEPVALLDKTRYRICMKDLGAEREAFCECTLQKLRDQCLRKGILVKPFFDDACMDPNSVKLVGHVTIPQFKQALNVKLGFDSLSPEEVDVLTDKYLDDEYGDMINYIAFAAQVDPPTDAFQLYKM